MKTTITAEQFEQRYVERYGVTVEWLKENGREPRPCDCGSDLCQGWRMALRVEEEFAEWEKHEARIPERKTSRKRRGSK